MGTKCSDGEIPDHVPSVICFIAAHGIGCRLFYPDHLGVPKASADGENGMAAPGGDWGDLDCSASDYNGHWRSVYNRWQWLTHFGIEPVGYRIVGNAFFR